MSLQHHSSQRSKRSLASDETTMRLHGGALVLARGVWIVAALAVLIIFFATLPANFVYLHTILTTGTSLKMGRLGRSPPTVYDNFKRWDSPSISMLRTLL